MNFYQRKLQEKKENLLRRPEDASQKTKRAKLQKMKHTKKNAQFGMF